MEIVHIDIDNRLAGLNDGQAMSLMLPIMRNRVDVAAGDELIVNRFSSIEQDRRDRISTAAKAKATGLLVSFPDKQTCLILLLWRRQPSLFGNL